MIVCVCNNISDRDIAREAERCQTFGQLQMRTGVAAGCGACHDCAKETFLEKRRCCMTPETAAPADAAWYPLASASA